MNSSSPAAKIILEYVCPALGVLTANAMWVAPIQSARAASARGHLGSLNPTPWAFMTGNCAGWVFYSYLIQNQFVFWGNWPGLIISVWLNLCAAKLQYQGHCAREMRKSFVRFIDNNRESIRSLVVDPNEERGGSDGKGDGAKATQGGRRLADTAKMVLQVTTQKIHAPAPHEKIVVGMFLFWLLIASVVAFLKAPLETKTLIVGLAVNFNLVFFYGAPLSTIFTVLRERNAESIHVPTMLTNTANGAFWTSYGWAVWDLYIAIPNGLGALLGVIQILLVVVFPRRRSSDELGLETPEGHAAENASAGDGANRDWDISPEKEQESFHCEDSADKAVDIEQVNSNETELTENC